MNNLVNEIIEFCLDNDIVLVSHGLAPNPFGFCFELYGDASSDEAKCLDEMLGQLNSKQEKELIERVF